MYFSILQKELFTKKDYWQRLLWWCALDTTLITMNELRSQPSVQGSQYLPSANEVCEGYVFTRVCLSMGSVSRPYPWGGKGWGVWLGGGVGGGVGLPAHTQGGGSGSGQGVSRPIPRGDVGESGWGKVSRPRPGGWVSRPRPGGSPGPGPGVCILACTEANPHPPADSYCCGPYISYWNALLSYK